MDKGLEELEQLMEDARQTIEETSSVTARGGGSPIEKRLVQAFVDTSAVLSEMVSTQTRINEQQEILSARLNDLELCLSDNTRVTKELRRTLDDAQATMVYAADNVVSARLERFDEMLASVNHQVKQVLDTLGEVDKSKAHEYSEAVDASVKKLTKATALSAGVIGVLAIFGGALAGFGAWWLVKVVPPLQAFMSEYGFWALLVIGFIVFFAWCIATRKR